MYSVFAVSSEGPQDVQGGNLSSTSLMISWGKIRERQQNGIIIGYQVGHRERGSDKWSNVTVGPAHMKLVIESLHKYTLYEIRVAGVTVIGVGNFTESVLVRTDEDGKQLVQIIELNQSLFQPGACMTKHRVPVTYFK